jgi:hypothetical protein
MSKSAHLLVLKPISVNKPQSYQNCVAFSGLNIMIIHKDIFMPKIEALNGNKIAFIKNDLQPLKRR